MSNANIVTVDWAALSLGERIRYVEVEGYVVLPNLLSSEHIARLKAQTAKLETKAVDYSIHQQIRPNIQFEGGAITELAAHPLAIAFLKELMGDEIILMSYAYARSEPGHPGISLHTDGQPYGSKIFGFEGSCPWLVRVLYYLDELTPEVSPFRVVPDSHLSMHADANPYKRYESHPEERMVPVKAGSAVLINHHIFHGNFPNTGKNQNVVDDLTGAGVDPAYLRKTPLGRRGLPEEIGAAAAFLASDDASFVHGTTLIVDGGFLIY